MEHPGKKRGENSVVCSRTVSLLVENIENAAKSKASLTKECPELKTLKGKLCDVSVCMAFCAGQGIAHLVERKILNPSQTVSSLISLLPSVIHYSPLVTCIGNILLFHSKEEIDNDKKYICQYNFTDRSHPFVIILKHDSQKSWNAIYSYLQYLFHYNNNKISNDKIIFENKISFLQLFFLYVFCDPTSNSLTYKNDLFLLLLKHQDKIEVKKLIIQGLAWQKINMNYCLLLQEICCNLLTVLDKENKLIIAALSPYLALSIKWLILNAHNPILWIDLLSKCLQIDSIGASAALFILSDVLLDTPALFINNLIDLCKSIVFSLRCNKYVAQKFASVSLIWMVNPSSLAESLFHNLETIMKFLNVKLKTNEWIKQKTAISDNRYFDMLKSSDSEVKTAVEMAELCDNWKNEASVLNWLKNLKQSNNSTLDPSLNNFVSGLFLYENNNDVLEISSEILVRMSNSDNELCFHLVCFTFFKLTREIEPKRQLKYLQTLVKIGFLKENVPLIIGILETLKNDESKLMLPVVIDLYLRLWKTDNRVYSYLHKTLFSYGDNSWEVNVMKTIALREICKLSPETHGKSLVSKLSEVLNDCDNYSNGIPSAIAIEAVIELCKASVTDITGAWKALKPKLSRDKRREVVISLCKLFSHVPELKSTGSERDALTNDVVPRLWSYLFSDDVEIMKASLMALSKFTAESYGPKLLPDLLKTDIELPKQYWKQGNDVSRESVLEQLEYVPGECWIEVIQRVDSRVVENAGNMITELIQQELNSLGRRFFCHPEEVPEPVNYVHLPHSSVCRALVFHIQNYLKTISESRGKIVVPHSVSQSLRILSRDYSKCLPVLDWSFLENFFALSEECKKYSITILAKQSTASKAGRKVLENYMANNVDKFENVNEFIFLYSALPYVCNSLTANTLRQFLDKTIKTCCSSSLNTGSDHFEIVLKNAKIALGSKLVPDPRKALLAAQIQNVFMNIPPEHEVMKKYAEFVVDLPAKTVETMTCPSSWTKVTQDKVRRSIYVRKIAAFHPDSTNPLVWFNSCIDAVLNIPNEHNFIINSMMEVLRKKRTVNHSTWLTELIWRIQSSISSVDTPESTKATLFLLKIFCICSITLSGCDWFLSDSDGNLLLKKMLNFFPLALHKLLNMENYQSLSSKMIDFIHGLSKWKSLPQDYVETLEQAILMLRNNGYCSEKNKWLLLFYLPAIRCFVK